MLTLIIGDNQGTSGRLRHALAQHGHECPVTNVVSVEGALDALQATSGEPDLILLVFGQRHERCEALLRQLRTCAQARIVAVGPRDPNLILGAIHAGADDFLDETEDLHRQLSDSLRRVAPERSPNPPNGQVVTVMAGSGGNGRTTIATNLAVLLSRRHKQCGLLDLDLQSGAAATFLNLKPRFTIGDLCRSLEQLDHNMFSQSLLEDGTGVHVVPAPETLDDAEHVTTEGLGRVLRLARSRFSRVVVDVNDYSRECHQQVLRQSSIIVLLCRLDFATIRNTHRALHFLDELEIDRSRIRFVANRSGQPGELSAAKAEAALKLSVAAFIPDDPKSVNRAVNCGTPCVVEAPRSKFSAALAALANEIEKASAPIASSAAVEAAREGTRSTAEERSLFESGRAGGLVASIAGMVR